MGDTLVPWTAAAIALLGSGLLAMSAGIWSRWVLVAFLASSALWIIWAIYTSAMHVLVQHLGFILASLFGVYRWSSRCSRPHRFSVFNRFAFGALLTIQVAWLRWSAGRVARTR